MTRAGAVHGDGEQAELLGIYLNDHLAGATGGVDLARRVAEDHEGSKRSSQLGRVAAEIAADRDALVAMMQRLDQPIRRYKVYLGWAAEKAGRLKTNGRLLSRSPLSSLVELEALTLGIRGKIELWQTLSVVADRDPRLERARLDALLTGARDQLELVEAVHAEITADLFGAR